MNENVNVDGSVNLQSTDWPIINGKNSEPLTYDAKVPAQSINKDNIEMAQLELTFNWNIDGVVLYPNQLVLGKGSTAQLQLLSTKNNKENEKPITGLIKPFILNVNAEENNNLTFTSSNANIATVDKDGKVTGINPGITTITTADNDSTDTCQITVLGAFVSTTEGGVLYH